MDLDEARAEVSRILAADLDALTDRRLLSVLPAGVPDDWALPEADRRALWTYGLPPERDDELLGVVAGFQAGAQPALEVAGGACYAVGSFGAARVVARAGSGEVLAVAGFTVDQVHPQLRDGHPDAAAPVPLNSGANALVEFAWRWHHLLPVLTAQQIRAGQQETAAWRAAATPAERSALPDFYAGVRALCHQVLDRFRELDPAAVPDDGGEWRDAVLEYL